MSHLAGIAAASMPGFHPMQLDNGTTKIVRGWFDPRDSRQRTITSSRVSSYVNKISGVAATETGTSGPAVSASGLNGGPCLVGAGGVALLSTEPALLNLWNGSSGHATHTLIALAQFASASTACMVAGAGKAADAFFQSGGYGQDATKYGEFRLNSTPANTSNYQSTSATISAGTPVALAWRYNGSAPTLRIAGASVALTNSGGPADNAITTADRVALMNNARSSLNAPLSGLLGPLIWVAGLLSDAECDDACDGVRAWYGLARLT